MTQPFALEGKVAFVTGASSGLGRRFALTLARAGAKVAVTGRRVERLKDLADEIAGFDGRAVPIACDVTNCESIRTAVSAAETELGPISILINNSGVNVQGRIIEFSETDYDLVMDTNTKGAFFVAQEIGSRMIRHGLAGRIVNIASIHGLKVIRQVAIYGMSKAAVIQMTRAMALEWGRHGINVNALCPGYIETEINRDYWSTEGGKKLINMLPRHRVGSPEDLDGIILLLTSDKSHFINGAVITVDDGLSIT